MKIAIAQMNPSTGAFEDNLAEACAFETLAREQGADLLVLPPFSLSGDAAGNLWDNRAFVEEAVETLRRFATSIDLPAVVGTLLEAHDEQTDEWYGIPAACYCAQGEITPLVGLNQASIPAFSYKDHLIAVCVDGLAGFADAADKPDIIIELSTEDYHGVDTLICTPDNLACESACAKASGAYLIRMNLVGGADDKVYSGGSFALDPEGAFVCGGVTFHADLSFLDVSDISKVKNVSKRRSKRRSAEEGTAGRIEVVYPDHLQADWEALVLATRDYVRKNRLIDCVVGLSGGIDSALVATIAVDALGPEHVHAVLMPSEYSSEGSITDSKTLAANLHIDTLTIPIAQPLESFRQVLGEACDNEVSGLTLENLQARIRTVYLMALSNTYGWMLLNTGNKSEAAMGFSTLYGDTAGAFAPLGDIYKTEVFDLARWRNTQDGEMAKIPTVIIDKEPSAELYEGARDRDRLPEYGILDEVLKAHVEGGMDKDELAAAGFDQQLCAEVLDKVRLFEFKRRQEPLAPQISACSFAMRGWPITNRFSG